MACQRRKKAARWLSPVVAAVLCLAACAPGGWDVPTASDLSTGPVLQWVELDLAFQSAVFLETTSDGRVVVGGRLPGGPFAMRVTDDGHEWTALPVPDGVVPLAADASGHRWVLVGAPLGVHGSDAEVFGDVFVSDDRGANWIEATLASMPDEQPLEYASRSMRVVDVLASGRQIVVAVLSFSTFDLESLLADRGRIPEGAFMVYRTLDEDAIAVEFRRPANDDSAAEEFEVMLTYAELALSPEQIVAIERDQSDARIHLFGSDGTTLVHQAESGGSDAVGRWTEAGFILLADDWSHVAPLPQAPPGPASDGVILIVTTESPKKLSSPDGSEWHQEPFDEYAEGTHREESAVDAAGIVWSSWREGSERGRVRVTRESGGQPPVEMAAFERLSTIDQLQAGPAGLVAFATLSMPDGWSYARAGYAAKDGYQLRYDEPSGGVTLWDLSADRAVYVFESRLFDGPETLAGTHQQGDGLSYSLTFDDPDSANELVTFDAFDLQPVFGRCWWTSGRPGVFVQRQGARRGWHAGTFPEFWPWVGWSADGVDWGWQALPEAFDTCDAGAELSLAVGADYVVAMLQPSPPTRFADAGDGDGPDRTSPTAPRLFVARVP
ncbi:MAG: hypothetical protein F4070_01150 [Acidimicrobiales bacterium]|nr:hypothetical protein [Acidimicrobiales bacterium]MYJ46263.1 hypothetical protein [Acidimicrobiales bacterium]